MANVFAAVAAPNAEPAKVLACAAAPPTVTIPAEFVNPSCLVATK